VKLIRIDEGDEIAAISKIQEQEEAVALNDTSIEAETEALEKLEGGEPDVENQDESEDNSSNNTSADTSLDIENQ
jgi:DNA gyrase subunit A